MKMLVISGGSGLLCSPDNQVHPVQEVEPADNEVVAMAVMREDNAAWMTFSTRTMVRLRTQLLSLYMTSSTSHLKS